MIRRPPRSTLFPTRRSSDPEALRKHGWRIIDPLAVSTDPWRYRDYLRGSRSEEHTSELQSLRHLVCRLLLEKKKNRPQADSQNRLHANQSREITAYLAHKCK